MRKLYSCGLHLGFVICFKNLFLHQFFSFSFVVCVCFHISEADLGHAEEGVMTGMVLSPLTTGVGGLMTELCRILLSTGTLCGAARCAFSRAPQPASALCRWRWFYLRSRHYYQHYYFKATRKYKLQTTIQLHNSLEHLVNLCKTSSFKTGL